MRGPLIALLACITAAAGTVCSWSAEPAFPYKAYVTADDVYVRSGPGENYYPTDQLKAGTEVEVYRHDPGGWYAIRPPKDSFSWVSSRHLQLDGNNLATVTDERRRGPRRQPHERDPRRDPGPPAQGRSGRSARASPQRRGQSAPAAWYKIAPPAGEFRWISGRFVDPDYDRDGVRNTGRTIDLSGRATGRLAGDVPRPRDSPEQFQKQFDGIDLELSTLVVEDPNLWELGDLRQRAETLFNQSETAPIGAVRGCW